MAIFNSYVKLPEGMGPKIVSQILHGFFPYIPEYHDISHDIFHDCWRNTILTPASDSLYIRLTSYIQLYIPSGYLT